MSLTIAARPVLLREGLGDVLRELRLQRGLTLRQVSARAAVSLGYLSEIERGHKEASSELLASICDALNVDLSTVLLIVAKHVQTPTLAPVRVEAAA